MAKAPHEICGSREGLHVFLKNGMPFFAVFFWGAFQHLQEQPSKIAGGPETTLLADEQNAVGGFQKHTGSDPDAILI